MAEVASAPQPNQQVPLDTIPISPTENSGEGEEQSSTNNAGGEGEIRTVFHDPENFNVKHPLMNTWTLWFTKPPSGKVRHCPVLGVDCSMLTTVGRQLGRAVEGGHLI
jgi:translation initiation factor 4E